MALTRPKIWDLDTNIEYFKDPITVLHQGATQANVDVGFVFNRANGLVSNVALYWSESAQSIVTAYTTSTGTTDSNVTVSSYANLTVGNVLLVNGSILNVTGNINANTVGTMYGNVVGQTGGNSYVTGSLIPTANVAYDLGSTTNRWRTLYISGNTIDMGGATIKNTGTGFVLTSVGGSQFNFDDNNGFTQITTSANNAGTFSTVATIGNLTVGGNVITTNGIFWSNGKAYSSGAGTVYTSTSSGNITITGSNVSLTATGPGATTVGSSSAIPVVTTDAYGRISSLTTLAVIAPAGTLTGSTLASGVTASSLTSVGTLTGLTVTGTITGSVSGSAATVTAASQPSITTLTGLTGFGTAGVTTTAAGNFTITGCLIVNGTTTTINNTTYETTEYVNTVNATNVYAATVGNIGANLVGTGTYLTSLNASNLSSGTVPSAQISGAYTGISQVGTLTSGAIGSGFTAIPNSALASSSVTIGSTAISLGATVATVAGLTLTSPTLTTPVLGTPVSGNFSTGTFTWPTFNQNTTGSAGSLSGFGNPTTSSTASTIVYRDTNGYIPNSYFYTSGGGAERNASGMAYFAGFNSGDYYIRSYTPAAVATAISGQSMNIAGSATTAGSTAFFSAPDGDRNAATKLPTTSGHGIRGDFVSSSSAGMAGGNYAGVLTYAPWDGTTASTGDASYQLAFGSTATNGSGYPQLNIRKGIDSTWNAWYNIFHSGQTNSPSTDNTWNLGSASNRFATVYGVTFSGTSTTAKYADLAENYVSDAKYDPGTVVVFGGDNEITITTTSHDSRVAGVISTDPAYLMNSETDGLPVAMTGRVPCQVQGPVAKGQVLVTSTTAGVAQAIDNSQFLPGCVIGKALEAINTNTIETIEVVVGRF